MPPPPPPPQAAAVPPPSLPLVAVHDKSQRDWRPNEITTERNADVGATNFAEAFALLEFVRAERQVMSMRQRSIIRHSASVNGIVHRSHLKLYEL